MLFIARVNKVSIRHYLECCSMFACGIVDAYGPTSLALIVVDL